jgi:hypothetical protein
VTLTEALHNFLEEKMKSLPELFCDLRFSLWWKFREYTYWYWNLRAAFYRKFPKMITEQQYLDAKMHGYVLDLTERVILTGQTKCNHRKGGVIVRAVKDGTDELVTTSREKIAQCLNKGTASQYSVMKHQMMNGDWRIRCTRCGKTWTAPIRQEYRNDREFWAALEDYEKAVNYPTNNVSSTSLQFRWRYRDGSDGSEVPRKAMAARV